MSGLRIGGLGSGMDTEMMLQQLMRAERVPLDRMKQQRQVLQWRQEDLRTINTKLFNFRNIAADMTRTSMFNTRSVTTSNNIVTATAGSAAAVGTYTVEVEQLGTRAFARSTELNVNANTSLSEVFENGLNDFRIGNTTFTFNADNQNEPNHIFINPETDSLNSLIRRVNSANVGVNMVYDTRQNRVFMSSLNEGVQHILGEEDGTPIQAEGFLMDVLNFNLDPEDTENYRAGQRTRVSVNGFELENVSNNFTFAGVNFTIQERGTSQITVGFDTNRVIENIRSFVNGYNSLVGSINDKLFEPRNRDFPPLTDEQRENLSDREAERWEEKARAGHLRNDTMLQGILNNLRSVMGGAVEGIEGIRTLSQIGIRTLDFSERGILHIDETRLRRAIEENPEGVQRLFTGEGENEGLSQRLRSSVNNGMDRIGRQAGRNTFGADESFIGRNIRRLEDRIESFEDRLQRIEARHWRQFTAMEKAMDQMFSQSQWLQQQLMTMF